MKFAFIFSLFALFSSSAFAISYVKCGDSVNLKKWEVTGYELEVFSQDSDFSGPAGENWDLRLDENSPWIGDDKNITAKTLPYGLSTLVEITIVNGKSATGPVGIKYKLIGLYDAQPVLEKYTMGGFAGTVKVKTFQCYRGN